MENPPRFVQEHPLQHLGRCLTQNTEFLQVVQVAQERKKAAPQAEWDLDLSSLDIFGWLVKEKATPSTSTTSSTERGDPGLLAPPSQEAMEHLRLFQGLWRLLELQDLPRAMEALLQLVQYAGQQRYSLTLLQREVESLLLEAEETNIFAAPWAGCLEETNIFAAPWAGCLEAEETNIFAAPWAGCLEAKDDPRPSETSDRVGASSACSTTSTTGPSSADGYAPFQDAAGGCLSDSDLSTGDGFTDAVSRFDPQDLDAWELQFLCVAAAEDLWRALRSQDLKGAMEVVISLRQEILQAPSSPMAKG